jgi:hypothetical protein
MGKKSCNSLTQPQQETAIQTLDMIQNYLEKPYKHLNMNINRLFFKKRTSECTLMLALVFLIDLPPLT